MKLSVIIPVINEEQNLRKLLPIVCNGEVHEVIVVDGGSTDGSQNIAKSFGATVIKAAKGRARQMNRGTLHATGDVFYFIHADSLPPASYHHDIAAHLSEEVQFGCFRSLFNSKSKFLRFNSYFSRFKGMMFRGGGQGLWMTRTLFDKLNGYKEDFLLMEEYDLIKRARKLSDYKVIQKNMLVSTRTYDKHGNFKTQLVYALVMFGFFRGIKQEKLVNFIKYWLK